MYVTYFSLFSYILSPNLLYPLLYKYTVILKLHVLNFILLPTSSYSASVLPQFLFIYQYIHLFCSIRLYFYIFCIFYVPKSLPISFLFIHTSKSGHYFPVSAYPCLQITFLYLPSHYAAPFLLHLSMYTDLSISFQTVAKSQPLLLLHYWLYFAPFTYYPPLTVYHFPTLLLIQSRVPMFVNPPVHDFDLLSPTVIPVLQSVVAGSDKIE